MYLYSTFKEQSFDNQAKAGNPGGHYYRINTQQLSQTQGSLR